MAGRQVFRRGCLTQDIAVIPMLALFAAAGRVRGRGCGSRMTRALSLVAIERLADPRCPPLPRLRRWWIVGRHLTGPVLSLYRQGGPGANWDLSAAALMILCRGHTRLLNVAGGLSPPLARFIAGVSAGQ